MKSKVTSTKNKKIAEGFFIKSTLACVSGDWCKRNSFASVFSASQFETVGKCLWNIVALLCKYSPLSNFWGRRWHAVSGSLIQAQLPAWEKPPFYRSSFLRHKKWLLQQSGWDTFIMHEIRFHHPVDGSKSTSVSKRYLSLFKSLWHLWAWNHQEMLAVGTALSVL